MTITDTQLVTIMSAYHDQARANGALEAVASEIAGHGLPEIVEEVLEHAANLNLVGPEGLDADDYRRLTTAVRNYGTRLKAELETALLEAGAAVRIVATEEARLGAIDDVDTARGFVGYVRGGTEGTFVGQYPNDLLAGWVLVQVAADVVELNEGVDRGAVPESLFVPVHGANIERVA